MATGFSYSRFEDAKKRLYRELAAIRRDPSALTPDMAAEVCGSLTRIAERLSKTQGVVFERALEITIDVTEASSRKQLS